jgi:hypothetical protein
MTITEDEVWEALRKEKRDDIAAGKAFWRYRRLLFGR